MEQTRGELPDSEHTALLILACSQCKRLDDDLLPAIERYDGPTFRVLRRFLLSKPLNFPNVYILSAEFGLLSYSQLIPYYDRRMTLARARELHSHVITELSLILNKSPYQKLFINLGQAYFQAIESYESLVIPSLDIKIATGSLGKRLSELHDWLYEAPSGRNYTSVRNINIQTHKSSIRKAEVELTVEQALDVARQALHKGARKAKNYQSWCVPIDDELVAPKWFVHQLTGLPVSAFSTGESLRFLSQLGIEVRHV